MAPMRKRRMTSRLMEAAWHRPNSSAAQPSTCFRRHRPLAGSCKCCDVVRRVVGSRCMLLQRAASVSRGAHASVEFDHRQHPPALVRAQVPKDDLSCTRIQTAHRLAPGLCHVCSRTGSHLCAGTTPTSALGLRHICSRTPPRLLPDWATFCAGTAPHICTASAPTSAPGLHCATYRPCGRAEIQPDEDQQGLAVRQRSEDDGPPLGKGKGVLDEKRPESGVAELLRLLVPPPCKLGPDRRQEILKRGASWQVQVI